MNILQNKITGIEKLLTPEQVAEILGLKVETLCHWRHKKPLAPQKTIQP